MSETPGSDPSRTIAVIGTGGKQVLVRPGATIRIETIDGEPASAATFNEVLLVADGDNVRVGAPTVHGASVTGTIVSHGRRDKVVGTKFKAKKRYRRKFGHRQHYTEVQIAEIRLERD